MYNAIVFKKDNHEIVNKFNHVDSYENRVIKGKVTTVDLTNDTEFDVILTKNDYEIGTVLPETIIEPVPVEEKMKADLEYLAIMTGVEL